MIRSLFFFYHIQLCYSAKSEILSEGKLSLPVLMNVIYVSRQVEWRDEVRHHFEKIKSEGTCLHRLDEELIKRRREELRLANKS